MIIAEICITNDNAPAIQHALELALVRGTYTDRERGQIQGLVDDIILARIEDKPLPVSPNPNVDNLVTAAQAFANDDDQRAWHPKYRPMMDALKKALAPFNGSKAIDVAGALVQIRGARGALDQNATFPADIAMAKACIERAEACLAVPA